MASLYRCANCGSSKVMTDTASAGIGYNYAKGALGTVLIGPGGAVAGLENKSQCVFKCPDCGMTLTYCMPEDVKKLIDLGVTMEEARKSLKLGNIPVSWSYLTRRYPNIEHGLADYEADIRDECRKIGVLGNATATDEEFDKAVDTFRKFKEAISRFSVKARDSAQNNTPLEQPMTLAEYYGYQNSIRVIIENIAKYCEGPLTRECYGISTYDLKDIFARYINLRSEELHGRSAFAGVYHTTENPHMHGYCMEELEQLAKDDPFLLDFMDTFYPHTCRSAYGMEEKDSWNPETFAQEFSATHILQMDDVYKVKYNNSEYRVRIPLFCEDKGRLKYRNRKGPMEIAAFFKKYPEKEALWNEKKEAWDERTRKYLVQETLYARQNGGYNPPKSKSQQRLDSQKSQIQFLTKKNKTLGDSVLEKQKRVKTLKRKLFGRQKALEEANNLEQEIIQINDEILKNQAIINNVQEKVEKQQKEVQRELAEKSKCKPEKKERIEKPVKPESKEEFYINLVADMGYFAEWSYADE